ncbi:MAG: four helix bundle protein [Chloroflexota bacterium]|nr:four helix bundle protein [Chloroflexota bacterium]
MGNDNQGLESLEIWQKSVDYAVDICQDVLPLLPSDEKWALNSQLRRSVQSIPANIAEGYGRYNFQESIHFCYIARGSMAETKTHLVLAYRLGYIDEVQHQKLQIRLVELGKMLHGYIKHLRNQKKLARIKENSPVGDEYDIFPNSQYQIPNTEE